MKRGAPPVPTRLAVLAEDRRAVGEDAALGGADAGDRAHLRRATPASIGGRRCRRSPSTSSVARRDHRVGALVGLGEDRVERRVDRVGEDVGAGDQRHAERHGQRGQRQPQPAGQQPAERDPPHAVRRRPLGRRRCGRRPARATRSAYAAASASWVTITTVWPNSSTARRSRSQDLLGGRRVEVARRLVGEDHGRPRGQRAGDRDALLLAAGQLGRAGGSGGRRGRRSRSSRSIHSGSGLRPAIASGSTMFSARVEDRAAG